MSNKYEELPSNQDRIDALRIELNTSLNTLRTDLTNRTDSKASISAFHWALGIFTPILTVLFLGIFSYVYIVSSRSEDNRVDIIERLIKLETKLDALSTKK